MRTEHDRRNRSGPQRTRTATMRAIVQDAYGDVDVLRLREIELPRIADDEVLVRVHAAGVDRGVAHLMTGLPYIGRLAFGLRAPRVPVPGMDLAGTVVTTGSEVTRFRPGDEVFGIGKGAYAEYARAPEAKLTHKPASLTFEQAAAVPISGLTALQAVRDHGEVRPGHQVLIIGASGGVGTYAVQIARSLGATVTGVSSTSKIDLVRGLGADHTIDYTRENLADRHERYDVIIDIGGATSLSALRQILTADGTLVIVGSESGGRWFGGIDRQLRATLLSPFLRQKLGTFINRENHEDIATLGSLIQQGDLHPVIDRTFPLSETPNAIRHMEEGRARGKVVVAI